MPIPQRKRDDILADLATGLSGAKGIEVVIKLADLRAVVGRGHEKEFVADERDEKWLTEDFEDRVRVVDGQRHEKYRLVPVFREQLLERVIQELDKLSGPPKKEVAAKAVSASQAG